MILRSACGASLRIAGRTKSLSDVRTVRLLKSFGGQLAEPCRELSEKSRDPKDYKRYVGRPDDPPRKKDSSQQHAGKTEENGDTNRKVSDVKKSEKWTGRPEDVCDRPMPQHKTERSCRSGKYDSDKPTGSNKSKFSSSVQMALFSPGSAKSSASAVTVKVKAEPPPGLSPALVESQASQKSSVPPLSIVMLRPNSVQQSSGSVGEINSSGKEFQKTAGLAVNSQDSILHDGRGNLKKSASNPSFGVTGSTVIPTPVMAAPQMVDTDLNESNHPTSLTVDTTREVRFGGGVTVQPPTADLIQPQEQLSRPSVNKKPSPKATTHQTFDIKIPSKMKFTREHHSENKRHRIYAFGLAETGALGLYNSNDKRKRRIYIPRPLRHRFAEENRVVFAESGYGFTLFYVKTDDKVKIFGCGLNSDFQLGPSAAEVIPYPVPVDIQIRSPKTKILSMSAGRAHSVVATDNEGVFLLGSNSCGQCGRAVAEESSSPECTITQIKNFAGERVVAVQCGQDHSCFLTETGKVYACGWGTEGQTGQGHTQHISEPTLVEGDIKYEKIVKITGKCDTVLALNDKGELFGWGSNEFRQVKNNQDWAQVDCPITVEHVRKHCGKIVDMAAGSSFCCVLNEEGDVFVWGCGILGGGPELAKTSIPTLLPRTLFGANDYNPKAHPVKVYCGLDHMMAVNNLKHVYAWGKNKSGCLGIGNTRDQFFPYKLAMSADVVHVTCAVDHTIIVTDHE